MPPKHEFVANRVVARLSGIIQGIGMDGPDARQIADRAIADNPSAPEYVIEAKARAWMLITLA